MKVKKLKVLNKKGYRGINDIPFLPEGGELPYSERKFKNVIEKQQYWDTLPGKYGTGVKNRQNYLDELVKEREFSGNGYEVTGLDLSYVAPKLKDDHPAIHMFALDYEKEDYDKALKNLKTTQSLINDFGYSGYLNTQLDKEQDLVDRYLLGRATSVDSNPRKSSLYDILSKRDDIENKALFYSSLMDEGGDQVFTNYGTNVENRFSGFMHFGLDRIYERIPEFQKKGYLPKDFHTKLSPREERNEKREAVISGTFYNIDDVITAKNAYIKSGQANVDNYSKKEGIKLTPKARDFFTIVSYNYGEGGAREMMKHFQKNGLLEDDKFLTQEPESYKQVYKNALRRLQAADMIVGEGFFNNTTPNVESAELVDNKKYGGYTMKKYNYVPVMNTGGRLMDAGLSAAQTGIQWGTMTGNPLIGVGAGLVGGAISMIQSGQEEKAAKLEAERQAKLETSIRFNNDKLALNSFKPSNSTSMFNYMPQGGSINGNHRIAGPNASFGNGDGNMVLNPAGGTKGSHETGQNVPITDQGGQVQAIVEPGEVVTDDGYVFSKRLGFADKYTKLQKSKQELEKKLIDPKTSVIERNTLKRKLVETDMKIQTLPAEQEAVKEMLGLNEEQQMMQPGMEQMPAEQEVPMMGDGGWSKLNRSYTPQYTDYVTVPNINGIAGNQSSVGNPNPNVGFEKTTENGISTIVPSSTGFTFMPGTHIKAGDGQSFSYTPKAIPVAHPSGSFNVQTLQDFEATNPIPYSYKSSGEFDVPEFDPSTLDKNVKKSGITGSQALGMASSVLTHLQTNRALKKAYDKSKSVQYRPQVFNPLDERVDVNDQVSAANMAYADIRDNVVGSSAQGRNAVMANASANRFKNLNQIYGEANRAVQGIRNQNIIGRTQTANANALGLMGYDESQAQKHLEYQIGKIGGNNALNTTILNVLREKNMMNLDSDKLSAILLAIKDSGVSNHSDVKAMIDKILKGE